MHLEHHPEKHIHLVNTLSTGPEIALAIRKLQELLSTGMDFDAACAEIDRYTQRTGLLFALKSLHNLAHNGRVNKLVAAACGTLDIHILGQASPEGTLELRAKYRGTRKTTGEFMRHLSKLNYRGGRALIGHVRNEAAAAALHDAIRMQYSDAEVMIYPLRGLCSFYAEDGGILIGFEHGEV